MRNKVSGFVLLTLVFLVILGLGLIMTFFLTRTIIVSVNTGGGSGSVSATTLSFATNRTRAIFKPPPVRSNLFKPSNQSGQAEDEDINRKIVDKQLVLFIINMYKMLNAEEINNLDSAQKMADMTCKIKSLYVNMYNQMAIRFNLKQIEHVNELRTMNIEKLIGEENSDDDSFEGFLNFN